MEQVIIILGATVFGLVQIFLYYLLLRASIQYLLEADELKLAND